MASKDEPRNPQRRDVLGIAVGGSALALGAALTVPLARFVEPAPSAPEGPTTVGKVGDFPVGTAKRVLFHDRPVLILHTPDGDLRAFVAICTHLGCVVDYSAERNQIECPCHRGVFAIDGSCVAGPPLRPLEELAVTIEEGAVVVRAS
jgi:Rieske Fe-S protein